MVVPNAQPMLLKVAVGLVVLAVGVAIYWMNAATARHLLEPLRDDIRQRLDELEAL